ncbi:MAG: hypothetical protein FWC16_13575 [Defluviitaleaceae bacterium]|nr:hypothetical protein [Defluviitaleaceae bacterium]MCL2275949.1 hypothetical protein [Defluviitaleaceae bacterium]
MGTWSSSLYGNDTTCDVRDTYIGLLEKQSGSLDAYNKTMETCRSFIEDESEAPLFWYALAESQWKTGRLLPEVKDKALEWIDKKGGIELWGKSKTGATGWQKTLNKLKNKLNTEQRKEKRFRLKIIPNQNPWELNDVYAFQIQGETTFKYAKTMHGKYILMQKIGEMESTKNSPDIVMIVQIYNRVFSSLPTVEDVHDTIQNYSLLPLYSSPDIKVEGYISVIKKIPSSHNPYQYGPICMSAHMEQYKLNLCYPKDDLHFICNTKGISNIQHYRKDSKWRLENGLLCKGYDWHEFAHSICGDFERWHDTKIDTVGDGTFEYPTREQQRQIQEEFM